MREKPEIYAIGFDFADSVTKAWNRLRMMLNRVLVRRHGHPIPEWRAPILGHCGVDFSHCRLSSTQSFYSGQYSFLSCQSLQPIRWHQSNSTESPLRINGFTVTQYIGHHAHHEWGRKFEVLNDAVSDCKILLMMGKHCYISASGDPDFPYLIVVPAFYNPKPTIH